MLAPARSCEKPTPRRCSTTAGGVSTWLGAALTLLTATSHASEPLDERAATLHVCNQGPDAAVAGAARARAAAHVTAAGVLPNPSLVAEHQRTLRGSPEHETIVGVSVPLGLSGERGILSDAAAARRDAATLDADAALFDSALSFRDAYVEAASAAARAELLREQQAVLDELSTTIQALARSGEAAGYDLLRQQTQARLHRSVLASAEAQALAGRALLAQWTEAELVLTPEPALQMGADVPGGSALAARAGATARTQGLEAAARASQLEASAARRRWIPDVELFAGYRALDVGAETGHGLSIALTVPLTFFDHGQGEAARAEAEGLFASSSAERLRRQTRAEVEAAHLRLERLRQSVPELEQASRDASSLQAQARSLYAAGEAPITELLEAFRGAEEAQLARLERAREVALARRALMRAANTMFDSSLDAACRARGTR
jgi:cobalt-zinc-cadmium efflux system outer membrane protein